MVLYLKTCSTYFILFARLRMRIMARHLDSKFSGENSIGKIISHRNKNLFFFLEYIALYRAVDVRILLSWCALISFWPIINYWEMKWRTQHQFLRWIQDCLLWLEPPPNLTKIIRFLIYLFLIYLFKIANRAGRILNNFRIRFSHAKCRGSDFLFFRQSFY